VRRIAQSCGFVIAGKNYDFKSAQPFRAEDILDILPKVKAFEPETYLPEFADLLNTSTTHLSQGNTVQAFECAQQAVNIIHQITGPNHLHAFQADDQLTAVLINSSEMASALMMSSRCLTLCAQVQGLDCQDTVLHHMQLSFLQNEAKNYKAALQHLLSARYLLQIIAGERHPEMANILMRMAVLYDKAGDMEGAALCLTQARSVANDLTKNCLIMMSMASLYHKHGLFHEALDLQKSGYKTLKELMPADDEKMMEAKKNLEIYLRSAAAFPRLTPVQPVEAIPSPAVQDLSFLNDSKDEAKKRKNNKKSKAKK
jgi:protein TIF31